MMLDASFFLYEKKETYWEYINSEIIQSVYADLLQEFSRLRMQSDARHARSLGIQGSGII
jgi:hypothetical protein